MGYPMLNPKIFQKSPFPTEDLNDHVFCLARNSPKSELKRYNIGIQVLV